jgi:hypothetical protein
MSVGSPNDIHMIIYVSRGLNILCIKKSLKIPRGNQNLNIKEQTTQWENEKVIKDKHRSTKHTYKIKGAP